MTTTYSFIITATGPDPQSQDFETLFHDAGCEDATVAFQGGRIILDFDRGALSLGHAVLSAIEDVHHAGALVEGVSAGQTWGGPMRYYVALIHKDAESDFGVSFPDFPGCVSAGATLDEAAAMGAEALAGHMALMSDEGLPVPVPSSLEAVMANPASAGRLPVMVPAGRRLEGRS